MGNEKGSALKKVINEITKKAGKEVAENAGSNIYAELIKNGLEFSKEALIYVNDLQGQINELNREQRNVRNQKIASLQKQLDVIANMLQDPNLTYEQKIDLIDRMNELQEKIDAEVDKSIEAEQEEKDRRINERKKVGQVTLEVVTGVIPFTTAYRAIKKKTQNKKLNQIDENKATEILENEDIKSIESK